MFRLSYIQRILGGLRRERIRGYMDTFYVHEVPFGS